MAYLVENTIEDNHFNDFVGAPGVGANKATVAFGSSAAATNRVAATYGVGFGDRGYGQSAETLVNVVTGTGNVLSADWTALREAIADVGVHQGTGIGQLPIPQVLEVGDVITAHSALNIYDFQSIINDIDTNRLNTDSGLSLNTVALGLNTSRPTTWSGTINCTFTATFTTADAARYFFNSGGSLTIVCEQPAPVAAQSIEWARIFTTEVGTWEIRAADNIRSGSGGVIQQNGYYGLSTSPVRHYNGIDIGTGSYFSNDVFIDVSYVGATTNGAKGNVVTITVNLQDQHAGTPDVVEALTNVTAGHRYAGSASILTGIEQPVWALTDALGF